MSRMTPEERWEKARSTGDSIVVFGTHFDEHGNPLDDMKVRLERAYALRKGMINHRFTILTGGPGRGVKKYHAKNPAATEAGQMFKYLVDQGEDRPRLREEPFALDTPGNLIFSTKPLVLKGLRHPVFISRADHLRRFQFNAHDWFYSSGIEPLYLPTSPGPQSDENLYEYEQQIREEILMLPPSAEWGRRVRWRFEVAIRWLWKNAKDASGEFRYPARYGNVDEFLCRFFSEEVGEDIGNEKSIPFGML